MAQLGQAEIVPGVVGVRGPRVVEVLKHVAVPERRSSLFSNAVIPNKAEVC